MTKSIVLSVASLVVVSQPPRLKMFFITLLNRTTLAGVMVQDEGSGGYGYGGGTSTTTYGSTSTIYVGQLGLDMYDSAKKELVWREIASKTIDPKAKPDKQQRTLRRLSRSS